MNESMVNAKIAADWRCAGGASPLKLPKKGAKTQLVLSVQPSFGARLASKTPQGGKSQIGLEIRRSRRSGRVRDAIPPGFDGVKRLNGL
jgi:hypothetical protein